VKIRRAFALILPAISLVLVGVFVRQTLVREAHQFEREFRTQNNAEMAAGDTLALSQRLNSLSGSLDWTCILAQIDGRTFYLRDEGNCSPGLFRFVVSAADRSGISVRFTLRPPKDLIWAVSVFACIQLLLLAVLYLAARQEERDRTARLRQLGELAAQVAHDIRSPLSALRVAECDLTELSEEKRLLIRAAIHRIQDIANTLLMKNRGTRIHGVSRAENANAGQETTTEMVSSLIEPLITEKRAQFTNANIVLHLDESYGLFASLKPGDFHRVFSNLINNAVEASPAGATVDVRIFPFESDAEIQVVDHGKGIPQEVLARLGARGTTHGKTDGSGLGLYHARETVQSWGGTLAIRSEVENGTTVSIRLPKAAPPDYFAPRIEAAYGSEVVILDDDESIHRIWDERFREAVRLGAIRIVHFSQADALKQWLSVHATGAHLFLVDHELLGQTKTGLDLIEQHRIAGKSFLVTSRSDDSDIRLRCRAIGLRVVPKCLAGFIPITVLKPLESQDAVPVGDGLLTHLS
jgi:signal transduction histidine kinase